mmetsp:Transcript_127142/g.365666  ORF Transcript_127142/g.365666 Transcript_127142/m.365666 type:complete len:211 (+) Transcript_127142:1436-2068(+)
MTKVRKRVFEMLKRAGAETTAQRSRRVGLSGLALARTRVPMTKPTARVTATTMTRMTPTTTTTPPRLRALALAILLSAWIRPGRQRSRLTSAQSIGKHRPKRCSGCLRCGRQRQRREHVRPRRWWHCGCPTRTCSWPRISRSGQSLPTAPVRHWRLLCLRVACKAGMPLFHHCRHHYPVFRCRCPEQPLRAIAHGTCRISSSRRHAARYG